ncbi:MAG: hypothetical protein WEG36_04760 [Gemmatimonadota bacterium]
MSVTRVHRRHFPRAVGLVVLATMPAAFAATAQTPELAAHAARVIEALESHGISDQETFFAAFQAAWDMDREEEYDALRALDIAVSDAVFDGSWQNQPNRASLFEPYDVQMWTYDVIRSWGKVLPRAAFTWTYATQTAFGYDFGEWQLLSRVATDWTRSGPEEGAAAEREALALDDAKLRQLAIHGVVRGHILRGDAGAADVLLPQLTDEALRQDAAALYRQYLGPR